MKTSCLIVLSIILCAEVSKAEFGIGGVFGSPSLAAVKVVWQPELDKTNFFDLWGLQYETVRALSFGVVAHDANTGEKKYSYRTEKVTVHRVDIRKAFSHDKARGYLFGGFTSLGPADSESRAESATVVQAGWGGELRWIPGIGIGMELGLVYSEKFRVIGSPVLPMLNVNLLVWMPWF